jgi:hypothetical protein
LQIKGVSFAFNFPKSQIKGVSFAFNFPKSCHVAHALN